MITNRQIGKTQALIELLHEDDDSYIITCNRDMAKTIKKRYVAKFKDGKENRILTQDEASRYDAKNGYIDEYLFHDVHYKQFKGAVSTMSFPIKVKRFKNNPRISDKEMKSCLTEEQYAKEFSLKFE